MTLADLIVEGDPWKPLRQDLFRNVELSVELIAITQPLKPYVGMFDSESLPAFTARASHESKGNYQDDLRLNKWLIDKGHDTPLQAVNYVFDVRGTSKSVQAQWTRHKIGVGWTYRSTRFVSAEGNNFVYCTYDYIKNEDAVKGLLAIDEETAKRAIEDFNRKRELGATKQDARKIMPVEFATDCYFYTNARALRHLFKLRLDKAAEWEIRRMTAMMLEVSMKHTPSLFQDQYDKAMGAYSK